jgi:hypothetical protein
VTGVKSFLINKKEYEIIQKDLYQNNTETTYTTETETTEIFSGTSDFIKENG